jgi:2-polyprenyl-3-methyl-5-hydroxy-6-metoxy-1,4-benzoquinol methylase
LSGFFDRAKRRTDLYREIGISNTIHNLKGKFLELRQGRYSLKYAYSKNFFVFNLNDSRPMAEYLAPKIMKALHVTSVIDLGCATGHWINAFEKTGIEVLGIEGAENAKALLVCTPDKVIFADLRDPLAIKGHFDIVMSIEVAEHIEHKFVNIYIDNMICFSPKLIMMTAAIPGQGGQFHVNEQESDYWDALFLER